MLKKELFSMLRQDMVLQSFYEDNLNLEAKVNCLKEVFGDQLKIFDNCIDGLMYLKSLNIPKDRLYDLTIRSSDEISWEDLLSGIQFYTLTKFTKSGKLASLDFNCVESGVFSWDCPDEVSKKIFDIYVVPYLKHKFFISINDTAYTQSITEEFIKDGVVLGQYNFRLEKVIDGSYELVFRKLNRKACTRVEGTTNTLVNLCKGRTNFSIEFTI